MATLVIKNIGPDPDALSNDESPSSALRNQEAGSECLVWLDASDDLQPGSETDAFASGGTSVVGTYSLSSATWQIFGPDGTDVELSGGLGTVASKQTFTPSVPGRWLVRLTAEKYIVDPNNPGGSTILETPPEEFGVVLEILDPSVLGVSKTVSGVTSATTASIIAVNERNEYDPDEGWGRTIERYLSTVSKMAGGRRIASGVNKSGGQIDIGKPVRLDSDCLRRWKGADASLEEYQNYNIQFNSVNGTQSEVLVDPIFLTLHGSIADGDRSYLLIDGIVPFNTNTINNGSPATVGDSVYISDLGELDTNPGTNKRRVGRVLKLGTDTGSVPGSIEFDGSSSSAHAPAANIFAESGNPIKAVPTVGNVGAVGQDVREWLTAVFFPFLSATLSFDAEATQEFGLTTNTRTLNGLLDINDEDTFTTGTFKLKQGTTVLHTFADPTNANVAWSKSFNVQPQVVTGRTVTYTIEIGVDDNGSPKTLDKDRIVTFAPPTYHALGTSTLTPAQIQDPANSDKHAINSNNSNHTYVNPNGKYMHVAVPLEYGVLTSAIDGNGFQNFPSLVYINSSNNAVTIDSSNNTNSTAVTQEFTMQNGEKVDYIVYRWNTVMSGPNNIELTFS